MPKLTIEVTLENEGQEPQAFKIVDNEMARDWFATECGYVARRTIYKLLAKLDALVLLDNDDVQVDIDVLGGCCSYIYELCASISESPYMEVGQFIDAWEANYSGKGDSCNGFVQMRLEQTLAAWRFHSKEVDAARAAVVARNGGKK